MNSDGYWSTEFNYPFTIRSPWYYSWWAYGFYLLFFCGGVLMVHRYQKASVIRKERERTQHKELEQAKEIRKAYDQLDVAHTNLKATQTQLIQAEKMASLGELTAGIAHEIQNPLNFVNNFSEVNSELVDELEQEVQKGNLDGIKSIAKDIKENEQKIIHHGKRADAIVKGMLQHSRSSNGVKEPTNINALADEYLRLAYHGLRAKDKSFNATMKTDFDETIGNINIIPRDIGRVILNLITNAFYAVSEKSAYAKASADKSSYAKASADKSSYAKASADKDYEPTVSVSTKKTDNKILISVKDNGNGIPQNVLDKIFQPFFTTKPTGQGTGLGLSLSYDIIKAHGGELKVETKEGEGAGFIIELPINRV
jgi:signal transduction histidine kinase